MFVCAYVCIESVQRGRMNSNKISLTSERKSESSIFVVFPTVYREVEWPSPTVRILYQLYIFIYKALIGLHLETYIKFQLNLYFNLSLML